MMQYAILYAADDRAVANELLDKVGLALLLELCGASLTLGAQMKVIVLASAALTPDLAAQASKIAGGRGIVVPLDAHAPTLDGAFVVKSLDDVIKSIGPAAVRARPAATASAAPAPSKPAVDMVSKPAATAAPRRRAVTVGRPSVAAPARVASTPAATQPQLGRHAFALSAVFGGFAAASVTAFAALSGAAPFAHAETSKQAIDADARAAVQAFAASAPVAEEVVEASVTDAVAAMEGRILADANAMLQSNDRLVQDSLAMVHSASTRRPIQVFDPARGPVAASLDDATLQASKVTVSVARPSTAG